MRGAFPPKPELGVSHLGPVLIPVRPASYGICDKYSGLYVEYSDGCGVFLLGEAYESMRATMTVDEIVEHFRVTGYMIQNTLLIDPSRSWAAGSIADATVTPITTDVNKREYITHTCDRGAMSYIAAVPNTCTTGFGMVLNSTAQSAARSSNSAPGTAYAGAPSYYRLPIAWNMMRFYQLVPLDLTRRTFLSKLAENVPDYSKQEVKDACAEAIADVLAVVGEPDRPIGLHIPFVVSGIDGLSGVFIEPPSCEHIGVPQYNGTDSVTRNLRPAGILPVVGFTHVLPQVPVKDMAGYGFINYGVYAGEDPTAMTSISQLLPARNRAYTDSGFGVVVARGVSQGDGSLSIGMLERPKLEFGCGHLSNILGPLVSKFHFVDVASPAEAVDGSYSWETYWAAYIALFNRGKDVFSLPANVNGVPTSESQYLSLGEQLGTKGSNSAYTDLSSCVGIEPRVLATGFGQALSDDGVSMNSLMKVHPSLIRVKPAIVE